MKNVRVLLGALGAVLLAAMTGAASAQKTQLLVYTAL